VSKAQNRLQAQALQEAIQALRGRQFARAEQIAASILRTAKTDRAALLVHAHALLGQQRASEAVAPLEKAILRGSDPELETLLGAALCESRRGADGIAQLRKTAARRPPFLPAFQELAGRLAKSAELTEAIKVIEDALALAPDSVDLKLDLGRLCLQANDRARARANLAMCLMEMGDRAGAEAALRTVVRGRPHLLSRAAYTMVVSSHGRFFFRPSDAAKFLQVEGAAALKP